ncbi:MAG: hypothetical protein P1P88_19265 [Bacteroidales bacterium]|nr:hypothetical protein [Bacteroidales bacterium]
MKLIKGLTAIGLGYLLLLFLNACCDKVLYYQWQNVVIQNLENEEVTLENNISQTNFGLRVNLMSTKIDKVANYLPDVINNAYAASNCISKYNKVDTIKRIDILLLSDNGFSKLNVGFQFFAKGDSDNEMNVITLAEYLNHSDKYLVESFDLFLKEPFEQEIQGRFIIDIYLSDGSNIADTTQLLNLTL